MRTGSPPDPCLVCGNRTTERIFSARGVGFTLAQKQNDRTRTQAWLCPRCTHVQTPPLRDIGRYYDSGYGFQLHDAEEDDIYAVSPEGETVFRAGHQAFGVMHKHALTPGKRVLDYGCGKARSLEMLMDRVPGLVPFVYDVSDAYTASWSRFVPSGNQAPYRLPEGWRGSMDLVLSFFALEHAPDARGFVRDLRAMLCPGGRVHVIVPDMYRNISDLMVVDHVHHFSGESVFRLFAEAGFDDIEIDTHIHQAAFVVTARYDPATPTVALPEPMTAPTVAPTEPMTAPTVAPTEPMIARGEAARAIAAQWNDITTRIVAFEAEHPGKKAMIYGSGVYGSFIASTLAHPGRVAGFLDANPFRQGRRLMDLPILAPDAVPDDTDVVYVGLNPRSARGIIAGVPALHRRARSFFYL